MKKEIKQMKEHNVFTEVDIRTLTPEQQRNIVESKWVLKPKGDEVRARTVAKGYTENIADTDTLYASTPMFSILRTLLTTALAKGWKVRTGDVSVAFERTTSTLFGGSTKQCTALGPVPNSGKIT